MLDSPQTGVYRNSGTRDDKRNPPSGAVLSISQNPWIMGSGKMTGSLPWWPTVVDCVGVMNVHAKTSQKRKSPRRKWRGLAGDLYSLFRSLLDIHLYLRGKSFRICRERENPMGWIINADVGTPEFRSSVLPGFGGPATGPAGFWSLHRLPTPWTSIHKRNLIREGRSLHYSETRMTRVVGFVCLCHDMIYLPSHEVVQDDIRDFICRITLWFLCWIFILDIFWDALSHVFFLYTFSSCSITKL